MSGLQEKRRWPRGEALAVASEVLGALEDVCECITIAGSIRRRKALVGDVELLYIPRVVGRDAGELLPRLVTVNLVDERLEGLIAAGVLAPRVNVKGATTWGEWNKLAGHVASGIPVDLFATRPECWANYLVCRTGPAESNMAIATAAQAMGWQWRPYGPGFERRGEVKEMLCEQEVFTFVGLDYKEPWER